MWHTEASRIDFLDALLAWAPLARPISAECLAHVWLQPPGSMPGLEGSSPPRAVPGHRHRWTIVHDYMAPDVLAFLREDVVDLGVL